jgi:hypothetical protein
MTSYPAPICYDCKCFHNDYSYGGKASCKAFKEIPREILFGANDDKKPFQGDHGIQFEEKT